MSRKNELRFHLGAACGPTVQLGNQIVPADSQVQANVALAFKRGLPVHGPSLVAAEEHRQHMKAQRGRSGSPATIGHSHDQKKLKGAR